MTRERPLDYIPVHANIRRHLKTKRFCRELGGDHPEIKRHWLLIELFLECAEEYPTGTIPPGVLAIDIAEMAGWPGDAGVFADALVSSGWIEELPDSSWRVVGWEDYAGKAIARRESERDRSHTNVDKRRAVAVALDTNPDWSDRRIADHCSVSNHLVAQIRSGVGQTEVGDLQENSHETTYAAVNTSEYAHSKSKSKSNINTQYEFSGGSEESEPAPAAPDTHEPDHPKPKRSDQAVAEVVEYYRQKHPTKGKHLKPGHPDWKRIAARLAEGFTAEDLRLAIDGNARDEWHRSNPAGHTVEFIFRNNTKVHGFIATANGGPRGPPQEAGQAPAVMPYHRRFPSEDDA